VPAVPSTPAKALVMATEEAVVEQTTSEASTHLLTVGANRAGASVGLALHDFPGWRVKTRSGPAKATLDTGPKGLIRLNFPTPGQYELEVSYGITPGGALGTAVSMLSLIALGLLLLRGSPWWRAPLSSDLESGGAA
jgi:hypothetical protein